MCELFNAVRSFVLHGFAQLYTDEHSEHILDSLCILDIDPLLNKYMICKYFSHFLGCLFTMLVVSFKVEVFNFNEAQLTLIYFTVYAFGVLVKK